MSQYRREPIFSSTCSDFSFLIIDTQEEVSPLIETALLVPHSGLRHTCDCHSPVELRPKRVYATLRTKTCTVSHHL